MSATVAEIMRKLPAVFTGENAGDLEAVVHFKFVGPEAGEWNAVFHDGTCTVARGLPRSRPTISLACDTADLIRVATGKLDGMQAYMEGKIRITGDLLLARKLVGLLNIG